MKDRYPHQLSGGQKQRVAIARAFIARPRLVICDEIVSGQDVSVQATILELVRSMQERYQTALLFVSHDLAVVRSIAQRVYVIQRGQIVESGPTEQVFERPQAEYSRALAARRSSNRNPELERRVGNVMARPWQPYGLLLEPGGQSLR